MSPSASEAVPEQINKVEVDADDGESEAATLNVGAVLLTVSEAVEVAVAFWLSVMVATQEMASEGFELLADNTRVSPLWMVVPVAFCQT